MIAVGLFYCRDLIYQARTCLFAQIKGYKKHYNEINF